MDLSERGDLTIPAQLYSTEGSERLNIERDGCRLHDPRRVRHTSDGKSVSGTRVFSFREDHTPLELSKYFYSPLPSESSIRLLRVEPGVPNDRLRCSLVAVEVEGSQEYEAVSYAWGVTSQIIQLQCDGKALDISRNLDDALHRLRNPAQARYVWADAVCINQRDLLERQRQVAMMRKIYKNASQVLIWIGRDKHDEAASAFSLATDIATTKGGAVSMVSPRHPDWKCIASLFSRPWFGRLWVVQEITLARRATIFWGDSELEWQELGFVAACIRTLGYQVMQQNPMPGVYNAYLMYRLTQDKESASVFFLRLLTMTRQFQCTDQRDRVYGLLGLPSTDGDPEKGEIFVQPDYTMSRLEVYSTVAAKILRRTDNLFLLSAVQHGPEIATELPSWIPQWDRVFTHTLIPADHSGKMHCASGDVPRQILRPITPTSPLLLRGLLIDTVSTISPVIPGRADTFQTIIELYNIFKGMVSPLLTYPSGHALEQAFCNVLCAGKDWYGEIVSTAAENEAAERQHLADFFAFWRTMLMLPIPPWYLALSEQGDTNRCWEAVLNGVGGRRFFVTQKGYIGIGPPCSAVGDTVVVLFGGTVPFLLRKIGQGQWKDSMWKLVGETYVAGLMHGESIEKMNNGLASEDFTIT
ncbi:HET-domain-containing protein [Eremomyces bilateralis CBS 781.70]|uniref:HET-domain-containing protein n=1 Tax=Eremomyces bilateralis CBS 781.70 TaxID=1392243 RepID=A0A6G1FW59_9PEZI|nr:HET-domain-containing protein [Eremomyces bilateralis CBS 781.70]KAF1809920.1 HET-domain-containing protein [Eremomyces bilateralis CBS 781.70]